MSELTVYFIVVKYSYCEKGLTHDLSHGVGDSFHKPSSAMGHPPWASRSTTLQRNRKTSGNNFLNSSLNFTFLFYLFLEAK